MAITGCNPDTISLFYVTRTGFKEDYEVIMSLKEIQSEVQRWNSIKKIRKAILTKGEEVDIEHIKPQKYKGKPYTYGEKYQDKTFNGV